MSLTLMHVFIIINKGRSQRNKMRMRGIDLSELFLRDFIQEKFGRSKKDDFTYFLMHYYLSSNSWVVALLQK